MLKITGVPVLTLALAGCALESQVDFDARPYEATEVVSRDYQAAYADVLRGARKCWGRGPVVTGSALPQSQELEAQLYPNLGYGEVYAFGAGTVFAPMSYVRVERAGSSARVSVKTGPVAAREGVLRQPPLQWAKGNIVCGRP